MLRSARSMPPGTDAVADGLADPVALRDLDVVLHAVEAADREAGDHEVGARERALAVGLGGRTSARCRAGCAISPPSSSMSFSRSASRSCSTTSALVQRRRVGEVAEQARRPVVAAAADDHDARSPHAVDAYERQRERDLDLDLDRAAARQRGHPDRGAAVPAGRAEHVGQQTARAVDHRGLLREAGRATRRSRAR